MKQFKMILLAGILAVCLGTIGTVPSYAWDWGKQVTAETKEDDRELAFTFEKTTIHMDDEAEIIFKTLKKSKECFEQESCIYQGTDRIYTYEGFELGTYCLKGNKERVRSVSFKDDTVATPEGLKIGSDFDDMTSAYGTVYEKKDECYYYTAGNTALVIETAKGKVSAITYMLTEE